MDKQKTIFAIVSLVIALALLWILSVVSEKNDTSSLFPPLENYSGRAKLLTFGLYVTPDPNQNPIDPPERFTGFHTALDLEILPGEEQSEVKVFAVCEGNLLRAQSAEGYGGVLIQSCRINDQDVTVLYGHVDPSSFNKQVGSGISRGEQIAVLSPAESEKSGLTRKHLHLQIHKGTSIQLLGYVQNQQQLGEYLDPQPLIEK